MKFTDLDVKFSEHHNDVGDFLHHFPGVSSQLVHGNRFAHQLSQAGLQRH